MGRHAEGTSVSAERSRAEIERLILRRGAKRIVSGFDRDRAAVTFELEGRVVRFVLSLPHREAYQTTPQRGLRRPQEAAARAWESECARRWRSLAAVIRAKFIAVDDDVSTFETEFMPYMVLPNGQTVGEWATPQIAAAAKSGTMPALLPG